MSHWDSGRTADEPPDAPRPSWPDGTTYPYPLPFPLAQAVRADDDIWRAGETWPQGHGRGGDERAAAYPLAGERGQCDATIPQPAVPPREPGDPWPPAPYPAFLRDADQDAGQPADPGGGRGPGGRRWLIPAGIVAGTAAVGAAAVLLTGGQPGTRGTGGSAAPPPAPAMEAPVRAPSSAGAQAGAPLTLTQAKAVLAGYTAANNSANARRSDTQLSAVETGSSYAIDAGLYVTQSATGSAPYPAFSPAEATYYIPRGEPADGPRWFVAQVANAFSANPKKVTSDEYLLFTQAAPGGPWQDTIEPYQLPAASAPRIQAGADGLATAVSPDAATVAVAPSQLPAATAASLDGNGAGQDAIADPGSLADRADQRLWQAKVPGGNVTDAHRAATGADGQEFALLTAGGGALVFYTDAAELTITPPPGTKLHLTVPGLYSHAQALSQAGVSYLEQFAAYDPPAAAGATPHIVADYSGITGKN